MEKLWLEASLAKGDMRPIPDEVEFEPESVPDAAPAPAAPAEPSPAEPARSFPEPLPIAESFESPERQRISPMRESMLESSRSGSTSGSFLAFPKSVKEAPSPAYSPSSPARAASPAPPRRRVMRPLTGN